MNLSLRTFKFNATRKKSVLCGKISKKIVNEFELIPHVKFI